MKYSIGERVMYRIGEQVHSVTIQLIDDSDEDIAYLVRHSNGNVFWCEDYALSPVSVREIK